MRCTDTCCQPESCAPEYRTLADRVVKSTRKPHPCTYCTKEIPAGRPAWVTVVLALEDRKCFSLYQHPGCEYL